MTSKTKINSKMKKKTNPDLAKAIFIAKKNNLLDLAKALSRPTRKQIITNLEDLDKLKENEIIVPGKVLSKGDINKKLKIYALSFSETAKEKLRKADCECLYLPDELEKNNKLNIKVLS